MKLTRVFMMALSFFMLALNSAKADITDGKFGINQIFDVQYYWSGNTLNASNFISPYDMNFQHLSGCTATSCSIPAGSYFQFFASTTNPGTYGLALYNANGTVNTVMHDYGDITALGNGAIFYVGSGWLGNVITPSTGYSYGQSDSFANMDTSVSAADMTGYTWASTTPLSAGQSAGSGATPTYVAITSANVLSVTPTSNNSPAGEGATNAIDGSSGTKYLNFDRANAGFTIKLDQGRVIEKFTITTANDYAPRDPSKFSLFGSNDGRNWTTIVNGQTITLSDNRYATSTDIVVTNTNAYVYYFITFDSTKALDQYPVIANCMAAYGGGYLGTENCNSVQVSEVKYYYNTANTTTSTDAGNGTVANPGTAGAVSSLNTAPTVVSTAAGADIVTTQITNGTPTTVNATTYTTEKTDTVLVVTRTTVPVTTTPTTVSTTTTPTTVTTWSDGTTTTANGTPVTTTAAGTSITNGTPVVDSFSTRIDQYSVLADVNTFANLLSYNNVLNRQSVEDGVLRFRGNVGRRTSFYTVGERTGEYAINGYTIAANRYGFGVDRAVGDNLVVGFNVSRSEHNMAGNNALGGLNKDVFSLHAVYVRKNWIVQNEVGYANNQYSNTHSLPELGLSNSSRRQGNDYWYAARLYTPDVAGLRPFVGGRIERNNADAVIEAGSVLTAVSYDAVATTQRTAEYGVRFDRKFQHAVVYAEVAGNSAETMIARMGVGRAITDRVSVMLGATHLQRNDVQSTAGNVVLKIGF